MTDRLFADSKSASAVGAKQRVAGYAVLSALGPKRPILWAAGPVEKSLVGRRSVSLPVDGTPRDNSCRRVQRRQIEKSLTRSRCPRHCRGNQFADQALEVVHLRSELLRLLPNRWTSPAVRIMGSLGKLAGNYVTIRVKPPSHPLRGLRQHRRRCKLEQLPPNVFMCEAMSFINCMRSGGNDPTACSRARTVPLASIASHGVVALANPIWCDFMLGIPPIPRRRPWPCGRAWSRCGTGEELSRNFPDLPEGEPKSSTPSVSRRRAGEMNPRARASRGPVTSLGSSDARRACSAYIT